MGIAPARWRLLIAVLGAIIASLYLWALSDWPRYSNAGDLGVVFARAPNHELAIVTLAPDSPLAAAGAKPGDRVRLDRLRDTRRFLGAGESIGLQIVSQDGARHVEVAARPVPPGFFAAGFGGILTALVSALALTIGIVIGLRQPEQVSTRFFVLAVLMQPLNYVNFRLPPGAIPDFLGLVAPLAPFALVYFCFAAFCLTFPDGHVGPMRARMRLLLVPYGILAAAIGAWSVAENAGWIEASVAPATAPFAIASVILSLAALALAVRESSGALRSRIAWIAASMGLVYLSYLWSNVMALLALTDWVKAHQYLPAGAIALGYFGLAYALLRHRVFDIGFAVNRALVYGAVSVTMLLAFGLLEWLSHKVVHLESQQHNTLLDAGIALVVFLAFNKIHHLAESWVERLFFQAWHRREEALRRFVTQASHIVSPEALLDAFRSAFGGFSEGAHFAIYLREADGSYRAHGRGEAAPSVIGEDDALAVALRTEPVPTVLEGADPAGGLELALPMSHRGVLAGFALLGGRPGGESYRPDEVAALGSAAHQVGLDLHALEVVRLKRDLDAAAIEIARANAKAEAFRSMVVNGAASAE